MTGLERSRLLLLANWVPGRYVLQVLGHDVRVGTPGVTSASLYPALLQGYALEYGLSDLAAETALLAELSSKHTDPKRTRYATHPAITGVRRDRLPNRLMAFGARATKQQCIELLDDLIREEQSTPRF